jgi:hypothetical protein
MGNLFQTRQERLNEQADKFELQAMKCKYSADSDRDKEEDHREDAKGAIEENNLGEARVSVEAMVRHKRSSKRWRVLSGQLASMAGKLREAAMMEEYAGIMKETNIIMSGGMVIDPKTMGVLLDGVANKFATFEETTEQLTKVVDTMMAAKDDGGEDVDKILGQLIADHGSKTHEEFTLLRLQNTVDGWRGGGGGEEDDGMISLPDAPIGVIHHPHHPPSHHHN